MTSWDIDYPATMGVAMRTSESVQGYEAVVREIEAAMGEGLAPVLPNSPAVVHALAAFSDEVMSPALTTVIGHSASAVRGTADAANAYLQGDLEMAATSQTAATQVTYPDAPGGQGR